MINILLIPLVLSFLVTYLVTPVIIKFAKKAKIVDDPAKNKQPKVIHKYPVPRGGGLATFIGIFACSIIFLPLDQHLSGILIGAIIVTLLGFLDDIYDLNPYLRFAVLLIAAGIPIFSGIGISFVSNPFGPGVVDLSHPQFNFFLFGESRSLWIISDTIALFWIVFMMNMLNMGAKGVDGQLPGVVFIAALTIALLSFEYSADIAEWPIIILAAAVAGSYLGFLPWNFYPQKIMPGFSGSTLAGYFLAVLAILSTTKVGTLLVSLGIPLVDTSYAITRRLMAGKSPFWGDRQHLHHKLIDLGMGKRQISYIYWGATAILGVLALNFNTAHKLYTVLGVIIVVAGFLAWITYRPNK